MGDSPSDNGSLDISWSDDDEFEYDNPVADSSSVVIGHGGGNNYAICEASSSSRPSNSLFSRFVGMGFSERMVAMALQENVDGKEESILEILLNHTAPQNSPSRHQDVVRTSTIDPYVNSDPQRECGSDFMSSDNSENYDKDFSDSDGDFEVEKSLLSPRERSRNLSFLVAMNFPEEEVLIAIERCGPEASTDVLVDFITAAQMARAEDPYYVEPPVREPNLNHKKRKMECRKIANKRQSGCDIEEEFKIPKPMIGFGVPGYPCVSTRRLPEAAIGPPYFYYENVANAPKGVWETISRHLYDIQPEFVDSKYFCAANRKRGYIHNLPIPNRFPILPLLPLTIQTALPRTKTWWPSWDPRTSLNCLQTCIGSGKLTERIRKKLRQPPRRDGVDPPQDVQKYVLQECRRWNLIWVSKNNVATLEPADVEMLLGFPEDYTRGISRTDRYKSLGNSFQVNTVAYHLSVLKRIFPDGIKVLSLFSGIGGGEVALDRLGIRLKVVVSVEISKVNQEVVRSWWDENQTGTLIHIDDVQKLTKDKLEELISRFDGFDLVIGGSPCNNLAGSNRHHRDGLEGKESSLFFEYCRILDLVKLIMSR